MEELFDIRGLTLFVSGQSNAGGGLSDRFVGDSFAVSNIDAPKASRLFEAGAAWGFGEDGEHGVRVGLLDLNAEFDASDPRGLFINSVFGIGQDFSQSGENGPSIFPTTVGGRELEPASCASVALAQRRFRRRARRSERSQSDRCAHLITTTACC